MKYLITGGCGFLGSNLSSETLKLGDQLVIFDNLSRIGAERNLDWLRTQGDFKLIIGDIRNSNDVESAVADEKPDVIFHLAGQVAMTTSISNPRKDFETNSLGTFNLLDSVRRHTPDAILVYSSTNKVYGDLEWVRHEEQDTRFILPDFPNGFPESLPLQFSSPYGCSKGCADQYVLDHHRIYGMRTAVLRHSSMYGGRQFATYDQGWIGWFCAKALETRNGTLKEPITISGNGKQVRDVLFSDDMVLLYFNIVKNIETAKGQCFNVGGGMENSLSLLELFGLLEDELRIKLDVTRLPARASDQRVFVADLTKIKKVTGWSPKTDKISGLRKMLDWLD